MYHLIADLVLDSSHKTGLMTCCHEDMLDDACGSGLAVSTGNAYHSKAALRVRKPGSAHLAVKVSGIRCDDLALAKPKIVVTDYCGSALFKHFSRNAVTVKASALYAEEQAALLDLAAVVSNRCNFSITDNGRCIVFKQLRKFHKYLSFALIAVAVYHELQFNGSTNSNFSSGFNTL